MAPPKIEGWTPKGDYLLPFLLRCPFFFFLSFFIDDPPKKISSFQRLARFALALEKKRGFLNFKYLKIKDPGQNKCCCLRSITGPEALVKRVFAFLDNILPCVFPHKGGISANVRKTFFAYPCLLPLFSPPP
ncbi:MAG: hypothetical protein UT13_C0001G0411 [Candidatus Pacebacteria bacterium GW2011_GWF2_38_9]|nr:MAG: hypothetical protein US01_C0001G0422 [candidate division TM6 bacterium GW2011_GWF2_28_16]KKQ88764.1 MAG: hypothetical protein UT13_C0001G0411 [Candidatus Pacebacteria bacterium GW2011_GWF2_38_9]HAZ73296.1 hypothetical protein [Candidatus Paceibacterota bacterium]